jgi:hypothetical protein
VIHKFEKHENYLKEKSKVRNDFESTLYSLKDDFENPGLKTFSTEQELQKLKDSVAEELLWLEENAWTAEKIDFERHFRSVQRVYNPIVNRSQEYKERYCRPYAERQPTTGPSIFSAWSTPRPASSTPRSRGCRRRHSPTSRRSMRLSSGFRAS